MKGALGPAAEPTNAFRGATGERVVGKGHR
jgi:hypothetical protein